MKPENRSCGTKQGMISVVGLIQLRITCLRRAAAFITVRSPILCIHRSCRNAACCAENVVEAAETLVRAVEVL